MIKKVLALAMMVGVTAVFIGGCSKSEDAAATPAATAATTGTPAATAATTGTPAATATTTG